MAGNMLCVSICSQLGKWRFPRGLQQAAVACLWNNRVPLVANSARGVLTSREGMDGAAGQQSWLPAGRPLISRLGSPVCLAVGMKGLMAPLTLASALAGGGGVGVPRVSQAAPLAELQKALEDQAQDAPHHTMHPITRCAPSHDALHRRMDGAQTVSAPRPGPQARDAAPCPRAALLRLPPPSKRLQRDVFALGLWQMLSIELLFRVFGRFVTVLEGNNSGTRAPSQQDTN